MDMNGDTARRYDYLSKLKFSQEYWANLKLPARDDRITLSSLYDFGPASLHIAAILRHNQLVEILLQQPNIINNINRNDFHDCHGTALYCATKKGNTDIVKMLIEKGADFNNKNYKDWTPLHIGAREGHLDVVKLLLENGVSCDFSKVYESPSPISLATETGQTDMVAYLLELGVHVESQTTNGYTLLHIASKFGHKDVTKLLLEKGADIHSRIHNIGTTPLHYAAERYRCEIIDYLILKGADATARDVYQRTPLDTLFATDCLGLIYMEEEKAEEALTSALSLVQHMLLRNKEIKLVYPPNYVFQEYIDGFYEKCLREIDLMNRYMIGDTTISLYKIIHDMFDETKLVVYLYNTDIKQEMENPYNHTKHFPTYSNAHLLIEENVKNAINRQCLLTKAYAAINCFTAKLPLETKMKIFSYLNYNDLNNFVKSHELF